jgi:hypothetical protein
VFDFALAVKPVGELKSPAFNRPAREGGLEVGVSRGVAAVAESDEVAGVVEAAGGSGDQVVDIELAAYRLGTAGDAGVPVAREDDLADLRPSLRWRGGWGRRQRGGSGAGKLVEGGTGASGAG